MEGQKPVYISTKLESRTQWCNVLSGPIVTHRKHLFQKSVCQQTRFTHKDKCK